MLIEMFSLALFTEIAVQLISISGHAIYLPQNCPITFTHAEEHHIMIKIVKYMTIQLGQLFINGFSDQLLHHIIFHLLVVKIELERAIEVI